MATSDGQLCNASILNGAYLSKLTGGTTVGQITLNRTLSGAQVTDLQQTINDLLGDVATLESNIVKNNFSATTNPTTGDDSGDSYAVGSLWFNVTLKRMYACVDATLTAAIWRRCDMIPLKVVDKYLLNFATTNVNDSTYVEIDASSAAIKSLQVFYPDGDPLIIAIGAASSEVDLAFVFPGGSGTDIVCDIPAGTRLSVKLITGGTTNTEGTMAINANGEA